MPPKPAFAVACLHHASGSLRWQGSGDYWLLWVSTVLAASFECAKQLRSEEHLAQVERVARQFQAQLDSESPTHELSAAAASERGMPALFVSLAHTAKAARVGVKSEAALERGAAMRQASE